MDTKKDMSLASADAFDQRNLLEVLDLIKEELNQIISISDLQLLKKLVVLQEKYINQLEREKNQTIVKNLVSSWKVYTVKLNDKKLVRL